MKIPVKFEENNATLKVDFEAGAGKYDEGYNKGHSEGYEEGSAEGYPNGYTDGKADGIAEGYNDGKTDGITEGYESGKADGKTEGYNEGYPKGYEVGKADGTTEGYNNGYEVGKSDGITEGEAQGRAEGIEEGKQAEYNRFWDTYQDFGNRRNYTRAFYHNYWTDDVYNPKYPIVMSGDSQATFSYAYITDTKVDIDISQTTLSYHLFSGASKLVTVRNLIVSEDVVFTTHFTNCHMLKHIVITGTIGQNGFNVQWSNGLTYESLVSIKNALADKSADTSGTTWLLTVGSTNYAKYTQDDINEIIAKGWQVK